MYYADVSPLPHDRRLMRQEEKEKRFNCCQFDVMLMIHRNIAHEMLLRMCADGNMFFFYEIGHSDDDLCACCKHFYSIGRYEPKVLKHMPMSETKYVKL